jgi:trehalose 6-phosphate synthase/phosphatase
MPILFLYVFLQFPIGIDSDRFIRALEAPQVQENIRELAERFKGRKVHLSLIYVDAKPKLIQLYLSLFQVIFEN